MYISCDCKLYTLLERIKYHPLTSIWHDFLSLKSLFFIIVICQFICVFCPLFSKYPVSDTVNQRSVRPNSQHIWNQEIICYFKKNKKRLTGVVVLSLHSPKRPCFLLKTCAFWHNLKLRLMVWPFVEQINVCRPLTVLISLVQNCKWLQMMYYS